VPGPPEIATVTSTPADDVCRFSESVAIAVNVWLPFDAVLVFHEVVYKGPGPETGPPRLTPSTWNCTELMVAALAVAVAATLVEEA
jgi:hypothetical protein